MAMIERMEVEEGFLDGLDLAFDEGLNVLIGPRGAGKTSVVELLRFCLDAPAYTERFAKAAREHALSVLGSGRVNVTLRVQGERVVISRTSDEPASAATRSPRLVAPIVLSQNEIEAVGLDAKGRLRLIDGFRTDRAAFERREQAVLSSIRSLTLELREVDSEVALIDAQTREAEATRAQLSEAAVAPSEVERSTQAAAEQLKQLDHLGAERAQLSVREAVIERTGDMLRQWQERTHRLISAPPDVETWPDAAGGHDPLAAVRRSATRAVDLVRRAEAAIGEALSDLEQVSRTTTRESQRIDAAARDLRRRAESLQAGAGAAARRLAELQEITGQLSAYRDLLAQRRARSQELRRERSAALDELDRLRGARFSERKEIASLLSRELGPSIDVELIRSGLHTEYASAIAAALRGSGLHYTKLAPQLARSLSPRELVDAVDTDDFQKIVDAGDVAADRARRVIDHIGAHGVGEIAAAAIDDAVVLRLLDGTGYKDTSAMSTGQRCTVVLPIVLRHGDQPVIVDQPEDHLDNAFIVGTLIRAITRRPSGSQLIVSTHNPNIPVLGNANRVVALDSDGRRGFRRCAGPLEDADVVRSITSIMEGGREAFERRASFYATEFESTNGSS